MNSCHRTLYVKVTGVHVNISSCQDQFREIVFYGLCFRRAGSDLMFHLMNLHFNTLSLELTRELRGWNRYEAFVSN